MKKTICLLAIYFAIALPISILAQPTPFYLQEFETDGLPNNWSTQDANTNPNDAPGLWDHCSELPDACMENFTFASFEAPSADNGFVFMDSEALGGTNQNTHISQLNSEIISIDPDKELYLEFYTLIATFNFNPAANALLKVKLGETWYTLNPFPCLMEDDDFSKINPERITYDLTDFINGATTLQIQWEWTGFFDFFWAIDDVALYEEDPLLPKRAVWYERFDYNLGDWEAITCFSNGPDGLDATWAWDASGDVGVGALSSFGSCMQSNQSKNDGVVWFHADYLTTGGDPDNADTEIFYVGELISPIIDLSQVNNPVALQFSQWVRTFEFTPSAPNCPDYDSFITSFSISTDGGASWGDPIDANPGLPPATGGQNSVRDSTMYYPLSDLQGEPEVRIKFTWAGNYYFWEIDDLAILERVDYDMKINENFFSVMPDAIIPSCQIEPASFVADVSNIGDLTATNVELDIEILRAGQDLVFKDTQFFGAVQRDSLVENHIFDEQVQPFQINTNGSYETRYVVRHDNEDGRPENDTIRSYFQISDTTLAKELGPTREIAPNEDPSYTYGNCFYLPNGAGWYARFASFGVQNADELIGENVNILLYEWEGDLNEDDMANPEEYALIGFNDYQFDGNESGLIQVALDVENSNGVPLQDDSYYILGVQYETNDDQNCFMLASDVINYQATWFVTDSLNQNRYASMLDVGNTGDFSVVGFGFGIVPAIRLHVGISPDLNAPTPICAVNTIEVSQPLKVKILPNPAESQVNVQFDLVSWEEEVTVQITNMSGSLLFAKKYNNVKQKEITFDVRQWISGTYLVNIRTSKGERSFPLIVQH